MKIVRTVKVTGVDLSSDDWGLYDMDGVEHIANLLNTTFEEAVNIEGSRFETVRDAMDKVMILCSSYGAMGTAPQYVLGKYLNKVFI